ncbi:MAG: NAD(+)/NADH kinase [Actinomycetota bacterium]|nr:NAD(+)/NADH kinase [Actinomycetota bacterium]
MTDLLFTAFSNRSDAVILADEVGRQLHAAGIASSLLLLDDPDVPASGEDTLVISLGGDGTFLKSARLAHELGARVMAVNLGRLGFLLNVPAAELIHDIKRALSDPRVVERLALQIDLPGQTEPEFALNEVVVERAHAGHMVRVCSYVDDDEYLTYSADGVMVATPTGSTGYNFSAGGPVIDTTLPVMVLTPIAPHFTIDRSIVVGGEKVIRLLAVTKSAEVVADGRTIGSIDPGESVRVSRSPTPVRVVETRRFELGFRLRESLREGHA